MRNKSALLIWLLTVWTVLAYSALLFLGRIRIDPIVLVPSHLPDFFRHGMPSLSPAGVIAWLAILAAYAGGAIFLSAKLLGVGSRRRSLAAFLILFSVSAGIVMLVHPTLLLVLLGTDGRETFSRFIERHVGFLDEIYFHWGLWRFRYLVLLGQVAITLMVVFLLLNRQRGKAGQ